jgi:predicted TIM-barrel fold metal-dependent hydrolase
LGDRAIVLRFLSTLISARRVPRRIDDRRLYPVWKRAGELGIPVLIHSTDPVGFFLPIDGRNEHYPTLVQYPE